MIPLGQPCAVKGYNSKTTIPITHLIRLTLKIQRQVQQNLPFLIMELRKHDVILEQIWLAKHRILIDCHHHQLLWPEEVSLKDKLLSKQDLFIPKSILSRSKEVYPEHQEDANQQDNLLDQDIHHEQDDPEKAVQQVDSIPRQTPTRYRHTYRQQQLGNLVEMNRQLERQDKERSKSPKPLRQTKPATRRKAEIQIALIRATRFMRCVRDKKTTTFMTSLQEIKKIIEDKQKDPQNTKELKEIRQQLPKIYQEYTDIFSKQESNKLPDHKSYNHHIKLTGDQELSYSPLYRITLKELEATQEYILENLNKDFIIPSNTPFASPILIASKPDGELRFYMDYQKLNALTKKDRYPLPLIEEVFKRLSKAKIFTKLDIQQGFHRIRMSSESENLTTFRCRYRTYKYKVMPFKLTNGPATFQRLVNDIFIDCLDKFLIAFVNNLLIYSKNELEHQAHVKFVLERLREAGLQATIHKCEFHVKTTQYLGFIITPEGIKVDPAKIDTILKWMTPRTVRGVQSFLGFCNFYRKFIQEYSRIAKPLNRLTRADVAFTWDTDCEAAFKKLKKCLTEAPVLCHYQPERPTQVKTDAADSIVTAVLSQLYKDEQWHPVAFYSATMVPAKRNYNIHDKEMLAIIKALKE
jgi:hypothetical protein